MIVPMKKVMVIIQRKDTEAALLRLADLGIIHIEHQQPPKGKDIDSLKEDIAFLNQALAILSEEEFRHKRLVPKEVRDWKATARHIIDCRNRIKQLKDYSRKMVHLADLWGPWGDFDPQDIKALEKNNIYLELLRIPVREVKKLPEDIIIKKIKTLRGFVYCVSISIGKPELPFKVLSLPSMSLQKMKERLAEDKKISQLLKKEIESSEPYFDSLQKTMVRLKKELEFQEAKAGFGNEESLSYLGGYIPFDLEEKLVREAKLQNWGISITDPAPSDNVPTLIRNPRWVSIIRPVFRLIEVVPGYREVDTSLWFLIFLSVFFAMLIGDAGYGIIFLALTFFGARKWGKKLKDKSVFRLLYLFSVCAILWGILSGTFFGQAWLAAWFHPFLPSLRNDANLQMICFFIGALHLTIGHLLRAVIKTPSLSALADVGWALILWGAFFLAKTLILGDVFPVFAKWLFVAGAFLVIFFTTLKKSFVKNISAGLGHFLLNAVNSFTDIVSYIRLFAVGLATVSVADAFNQMALDIGFNSFFSGMAAALVIFIGHTLNVVLGPMAVLVHGVRLNVLEFSNHIDVKWSGFLYKPLKMENSTSK